MGGRFSCGRRRSTSPTVEPEPECTPVPSSSDSDSQSDPGGERSEREEQELPLTIPRPLQWPQGWEYVGNRYRLTLGKPPVTALLRPGIASTQFGKSPFVLNHSCFLEFIGVTI